MSTRVLYQFYISAGEEQKHMVENAFNVLLNEGFLRNQQGVQSLEVVQKFYEVIQEPIRRATLVKKDLMDFCVKYELPNEDFEANLKCTFLYHAVITLIVEDSDTNEKFFHAVRVSKHFISNTISFSLQDTKRTSDLQ